MIPQYLEKLLIWRKKKIKKHSHRTIGCIRFSMLDDYSVDIDVNLPDMSDASPTNTAIAAERYAEFLLSINQGFHRDQILRTLNSKIDHNNAQEYLFIDNIINFWGLLYEQYKKNKKADIQYDQSVVKPSQVFRIQ